MKKKAFTLIELIAVLVILAILALIVTPLVMSIIKKARISADKRSIDAYGRSVELAIANYLLDNGDFPTSIDQLTIEYSGDEVVCLTTQLNSDSSVYLAGCTVGGRSVEGYIYGKEETITYNAYEIGDEVTYNNVDYYVIKASGANDDSVTLLKKNSLTSSEVIEYVSGKINSYSGTLLETTINQNTGGITYYRSEACSGYSSSICSTDYEKSDVKYVVDSWKNDQAPAAIIARLISVDDLIDNLGMELISSGNPTVINVEQTDDTPSWLFQENWYWTTTPNNDRTDEVWLVGNSELVSRFVNYRNSYYGDYYGLVRPVIVLPKTALN